jgi:molybdopterin/thiamine biosynthesis adenylyltransferase
MSQRLISHSPDLKKLRDEGYGLEVRGPYLLVSHIPYVTSMCEVKFGTLVSELTGTSDKAGPPNTHVIYFIGEHPCNRDGTEIFGIKHQSVRQDLAPGLVVDHSFSNKPVAGYADFYHKITTYVRIISAPAEAIRPEVTAKAFPVILAEDHESPFHYIDTASSRAQITLIAHKLTTWRVGIVGLGGTGSYVLDLIAKTPVREIHLFDGDMFSQHNAFRSPGAATAEEMSEGILKVEYFRQKYSAMHRHIKSHNVYITDENVERLRELNIVFLCLDSGAAKRLLIERLTEWQSAFIDVGMGIYTAGEAIAGQCRVTTSTPGERSAATRRVSVADPDEQNEYNRNVQIADLNALNAALAVIKWKKLAGFYVDLEKEFSTEYVIDGNALINEAR